MSHNARGAVRSPVKFLARLLALCMILSLIPTAAFAAGEEGPAYDPATEGTNVQVLLPSDGSVTVDNPMASAGDTVTLTTVPDAGFENGSIIVKDLHGRYATVQDLGNGVYCFVMPGDIPVTVTVNFLPLPESVLGYTDVLTSDYFADAVRWALVNGIASGTDDTTFGPNDPCTRSEAVTFLWHAMGSPEPTSQESPFTDLNARANYRDAVLWATEQGITNGTSATTFSPNGITTRAQCMTLLYRAAGSPEAASSTFADVPAGAWFENAVSWAVGKGITTGTDAGLFDPNGECSRAQLLVFLNRNFAE